MASTAIDMSKHFRTSDLIKYTLPAMAMMLFTSIYSIVDGFFISNFAGKTAFAAVNLIMPFIVILSAFGFMIGSGGAALVGHARGAGNDKRANDIFSSITVFAFLLGIVMAFLGLALMEPVARLFGADDSMLADCVLYGRVSMASLPFYILQFAFQPLFSTAGKPKFGLAITAAAGITNIVLDFILVGVVGMGVLGAVLATVIAEYVGGAASLIYFLSPNSSFLRLHKPKLEWGVIGRACINGSSQMMNEVAMSLVSILYNWQLMRLMGQDGVSAYGVIMYVSMIFGALLMGYCMGSAPLMSYQHGANNDVEKRSLLKHGLWLMVGGGVAACLLAHLFAAPIAQTFTGYDQELYQLTVHAFKIYSIAFVFMGVSIFGSSLFTALGNGFISALISFMRSLVFECGAVLLLPMLIGGDGIWSSVIVAELASVTLTVICIVTLGKFYGLRKQPAGKIGRA